MTITKDKLASLAIFAVIVVLAMTVVNPAATAGIGVMAALVVALLGLALIWFAEPLGETGCFSRGIAIPSPPGLVESFGWLFLVGYPTLVACITR